MSRKRRNSMVIRCATMALMWLIAINAFAATPSTVLPRQPDAPSGNTLSIPARQLPNAVPSIQAPLPQPETSLEVPSLQLRSQPGYEQVTVTVTDSSGKYVTNLKDDDFRILEDGQQRSIGFFRVDRTAPVSIGIIVDCSGSMMSKFAQARTAITRMVADFDARDDIFLESFSIEAQLLQPFTRNHAEIVDHLKFLHALTRTALYDAIFMGLYEMQHASHDKRALVVVTDGMDNASGMSRAQVIAAARAMKVLIYTIGIGDEATDPGDEESMLGADYDKVDLATLKVLSEETGARTFHLPQLGDGEELARDCEAISNELTQQYTIAYLSPDPGRSGYRTLHVDVPKHPELSVRVRKGVAIIPH
jgi:Ca-activated chloride channel family protein